jgi:hypothetical protein
VRVSVQKPHHCSFAAQQWPLVHLPLQDPPHAPQLEALVFRSTQTPPQWVWPCGQQRPLEQTPPPQSALVQHIAFEMQPPLQA